MTNAGPGHSPGPCFFHASVSSGFEPATAEELRRLDLEPLSAQRGVVRFRGSPDDGVRAALALRSAPRVVFELAQGLPVTADGLRDAMACLRWEDHLPEHVPWAARAVGTSEGLRDTRFTARLVKDAVRDRYRARGRACPPVAPRDAQILVEVRLDRGRATVGFDLGGHSLHERGTGRRGDAPLREDVAAGLALLAGVTHDRPLVDPFCGTGTLIAEAAGLALRRPPRRDPRTMAFARLHSFGRVPAARIARELEARALDGAPAPFFAFDRDPRAVREARAALDAQGLSGEVRVAQAAVPDVPLPALGPGLLLSNPPWGLRLDEEDARHAWAGLGRLAHGRLAGWTLALVSGQPGVTRGLGLAAERRFPVWVGGVDARLLIYRVRG